MVDVSNIQCGIEGCGTRPYFGVTGTKIAKYCEEHAADVMVDVVNKRCKIEGCTRNRRSEWPAQKGCTARPKRDG